MITKPLKYTVKQVENIITKYFKSTPTEELTITGLALLFGSKQLMNDYQKRDDYSAMITRAKLQIEHQYELGLRNKEYTTGSIFALKNFGWADKQEIALGGTDEPIKIEQKADLTKLSNEELESLLTITTKLEGSKADSSD